MCKEKREKLECTEGSEGVVSEIDCILKHKSYNIAEKRKEKKNKQKTRIKHY